LDCSGNVKYSTSLFNINENPYNFPFSCPTNEYCLNNYLNNDSSVEWCSVKNLDACLHIFMNEDCTIEEEKYCVENNTCFGYNKVNFKLFKSVKFNNNTDEMFFYNDTSCKIYNYKIKSIYYKFNDRNYKYPFQH